MPADPFAALTFIAGPAILTNACAIMQNGATTRYTLAITQWREFCASRAAGGDGLSLLYFDPEAAFAFAERRVRLQLRVLDLLDAAVALFAATTVLGLAGAFLVQAGYLPAAPVSLGMIVASGAALLLLLAATVAIFREGACGRALLGLHRHVREERTRDRRVNRMADALASAQAPLVQIS